MITKILKINPQKPEINKIKIAARIIKSGNLVAFPTETVYGLGANAFNKKAIKKIFLVKERPFDDPLIVHIAHKSDLCKLAINIPKIAEKLAKRFWPGPLTMVLKKSKLVPSAVTAGLDTVAIRMPKNKIALGLIKASETPIAAPSANKFTKPSPTSAKHVIEDLFGQILLIIDGGQTDIGLESTVIDLTSKIPEILRPGKITAEQLVKVLGKIGYPQPKAGPPRAEKSPGMKYKHYSPKAKVILIYGKTAIIKADKNIKTLSKNLFKKFRELDNKKINNIIVEAVEEKGLGTALMNRLKKAASKIIK